MTTTHNGTEASRLDLTWELDLDGLTAGRFAQLVVARALEHVGSTSWACEKDTLEGLFDRSLATQRSRSSRSALLDVGDVAGEGSIACIWLSHGTLHLRMGARTVDALAVVRQWVRERYPLTQPSEEQRIWITFWSQSSHGAREMSRKIDVPAWHEVEGNYPPGVARRLELLVGSEFEPGLGGRLILWHGPPGTGKTYALRALGWEWRSWCDLHYITDPEVFFGSSATYMLDVLLNESDSGDESRWRLLVLEDTGELLAADAKERTGQGLSRLLNTVDGLIGQGLRVLVLVTTNEALRNLHPAVSRPGRCVSQIEFGAFSADEAAAWLESRGLRPVRRAGTLAALFGGEQGLEQRERLKIGFGR